MAGDIDDFVTLKQNFLKTFAPRQNPLFYTSRLRQKVSSPFGSIQAYIRKFEEILRTTPQDMIANHDAIQIFLMNLPDSFKMELTLHPCDNIEKLITTASAATVTVTVDGVPITAILDTGCAGVTLSTRILQKINKQFTR